ncbi:MAG TPA: hypothetical protein VGB99_03550 [Acidobacteriota bacterium]
MSPEPLQPELLLRQVGEGARLETCPSQQLEAVLERSSRERIQALERHLAECRSCGALIATAMRSSPATDRPASGACHAMVRQALSRRGQARNPTPAWVWGLAALALLAAGTGLRGLLLDGSARTLRGAMLRSPSPLRLAPEDPPGGDRLRSGPAAPQSDPELERAEWLLRAARLAGAEPTAVALLQARLALLRGQPQQTLAVLGPRSGSAPTDPRIEALRAAALLQLGRRAQAREAARRQSVLANDSSWALYNLALLSEPEIGAELFARALAREPNPRWRRQIERARAALAP